MTFPVCPCDDDTPRLPVNLPQLSRIAFRFGDYAEFRRAVLTPPGGEVSIATWRTQGEGDLAVMMAEWFAYIGDILTFYDERIANESYLRTAFLDASARRLIQILGYRPRPAIGATGTIAALVTRGQSAVLPRGLQVQSKPGPGQPPQIFELLEDTPISSPDVVPAVTPPVLLSPIGHFQFANLSLGLEFAAPARALSSAIAFGKFKLVRGISTSANYGLLLLGAVTSIDPGDQLLLRVRDTSRGGPFLATVTQAVVQPAPSGGKQTALALRISDNPAAPLTASLAGSLDAAGAALDKANQSISVWSLYGDNSGLSGTTVHLSSLARQVRPGQWVLFTAPGFDAFLAQVQTAADVIWDANKTPDANHPLPIPHTQLTLVSAPGSWPAAASVTMHFDWIGAGPLIDQPPGWWSGSPTALVAATATHFRAAPPSPVLLEDRNGVGATASAASAGDLNVQLSDLPSPVPSLAEPIDIYYNTLRVTRGKTVSKEVLGSGDATQANQSFTLSQSPVTWLQRGVEAASTIALRVDREPWTEVASFYAQPADARIFVTREDVDGRTHIDFGDGINGARVPSGINNVVADYRVGAGASSPDAGKLTVINQPYPGLRALVNPVAVGGGADAEPASQIRRYAPRSVLTFGRAVSVFDYEALAAQAPGVTRARATWSWSNALQRAAVVVYVGDDQPAADSARAVLQAAGDPNRPIDVQRATARAVSLTLTLLVEAGWDEDMVTAAVNAALLDPTTGLFCPNRMGIGQTLFDSQIEEAVLAVAGTVAITQARLSVDGILSAGPLHSPGEGGFFTLDPLDLTLTLQADSHG
jgi:hypothetical protein